MPRIIVTTDLSHIPDDTPLLLDEEVRSVHLSTGHAAAQLVQRLAWAIGDAEAAERPDPGRRVGALGRALELPPPAGADAGVPIRA